MKVEVPDECNAERIEIPGTGPDDADSHVGTPTPNTAAVRTDDDGVRYVGLGHGDAKKLMGRFEREYDVTYNFETGEIGEGEPVVPADEDGGMEYERRRANAEGTANAHWRTAVSQVENGECDEYLHTLEDVDDRASVQDAIEARRDELE